MKKQFSRITCILMCAVMLIGMLPMMAFAGEILEPVFTDDFENGDKVWTVHPAYANVFMTEENDGTYDFVRINAPVSGKGGGAYSYAVPATAGTTYTVELTYKSPINPTIYCYSRANTDVVSGATLHSSNQNIQNGTASWLTKSVEYTAAAGATHINLLVYIGGSSAPSYIDLRSVVIKNKATGEVVEDLNMAPGWNYYTRPTTDGTQSIAYGQLHSGNATTVANFKTGATSNGFRSPVIPVTGGETYQISFGYSSHKNTNAQIEYWQEAGPTDKGQWNVTKYSVSGYNGFKSQQTITSTAPEGAAYMTVLFYDQYYNLFLDDVQVSKVVQCQHSETETTLAPNGDGTHTEKTVCSICGDVLSQVSGSCADGSDTDAACDICGYDPEAAFSDDFESGDKVWTVHPAYVNVFLTEENDGTYDFMRINAPVSGKGGGAYSYAVPATAGTTYTVELTYKSPINPTIYCYSRANTDVVAGATLGSSNKNIDNGTDSWLTRSVDYTAASGATHINLLVYIGGGSAPSYIDLRSVVIKNKATGEVVENLNMARGWNYYARPTTDGTQSISYGQLHSGNATTVANFKTGATSNGLRSPLIPVTAGESYQISFGYSSHKNTNVQIEYWTANGPTASQWNVTKYSMSGYNGFKSQQTVTSTVPEGAAYMSVLFYDAHYNLFVDNVSVSQPLPCAHDHTSESYISNEDGTHTVKMICACGELVSASSAPCTDAEDAGYLCDNCQYDLASLTKVNSYNITLGDDLTLKFLLSAYSTVAANTSVNISVAGGEAESYALTDLPVGENGYYVFTVDMAAAQMTDDVTVQFITDGVAGEVYTYSIAGYAETVLANEKFSAYHAMVREMLNYGAAAQNYFVYNTDKPIAESLYAGAGAYEIDANAIPEKSTSGSVQGITYDGASMMFTSKNAVRFYFSNASDINAYTFTANGTPVTPQQKGKTWYVEVGEINPHQLGDQITLTVTDGTDTMTIVYGPLNYMARMSQNGAESLKVLLKAMYNYYLSAKAFMENSAI